MSDLYRLAAAFPGSLRGRLAAVRRQDLRECGLTSHMIDWRAGQSGPGDRHDLERISRDAYLRGASAADLLDRIRAAMLVLPPQTVVGFHTAAALHGFGVARSETIHVVVPAGTVVPHRRGIVAHESVLGVAGAVYVHGVPCTAPARTAVDLARLLPRRAALPVLDAGLHVGAFTEPELLDELVRHHGLRGVRQARELAGLADRRPECCQESQLRLVLHDAGVRGFVPQVTVVDENGWEVCRIDLADEQTQTGLEYDGVSHLDRDRARADRSRHNWLAARGWTMRYFTDADLYRRPDYLVQVAKEAQRAARHRR